MGQHRRWLREVVDNLAREHGILPAEEVPQ
jgi:hypothetical protein